MGSEIGAVPAELIEGTIDEGPGIARAYSWPEVAKVLALYYTPLVLLLAIGAVWLLVDKDGLRQIAVGASDETTAAVVVGAVVTLPSTLLAVAYIAARSRAHGLTWGDLGVRKAPLGRSLKYIFGFFALAIVSTVGLVVVLTALRVPEPEVAVRSAPGAAHWIWLLVGGVIAGPLGEELIHRGMVFGFLRHRHRFIIAALISSAVFALVHLSPVAFVTALPFGLYLCFMYQRLGSIVPGMVLHMSWNLVVSLAQ